MAFGQGLQSHQGTALHKGKNLKLIAIVGVGALALFLIIRARSASASSATPTTIDPTTGQPVDTTGAGTPSTFADNGGQAAALGDAVTNALGGVQTSLDNLTQSDQAMANALSAGSTPATSAPADATTPINVTINTAGAQKTNAGSHHNSGSKAGQNGRRGTSSTAGRGKSGTRTSSTKGKTRVANHGGGHKQHGGTKRHGHTKH